MRRLQSRIGGALVDGTGTAAFLVAALLVTAAQSHAAAEDPNAPPPAKHHKAAAVQATATAAPAPRPAAPASTSVVINLIRLLVQEGVLTQDKANALIHQAEDEAAAAARGQVAAAPAPTPGAPTSVRVPYVPEIVRKQITEQVKQEVMQQARAENWAAPDALPEWTKRVKLSGDFRLRYEWDVFDKRNSAYFPNFYSLDSGSPFDLRNAAGTLPPLLDTTVDRQRLRERFRLGLDAEINDEFSFGARLATGSTTNPVSTNQTLGTTLANDSFDLDRAYLRYQPASWLTAWAGRFANPWFSTDLVWDDDVNFDGVAVQVSPRFGALKPFLTAGAFPIQNTIFNFPDNAVDKNSSYDKWLYAAQLGTEWRPSADYAFKVGLSYYYFQNIQGQESSLCTATTSADPCSTDSSRPLFLQQGNSLFAIRHLTSNSTNPPEFEYYGLASPFHELNLTARADLAWYDPVHVIFDVDFVKNLAFNRAAITALDPVNNRAGTLSASTTGPWDGGDNAFMARLTVGYPVLRNLWEWNLVAGYKYIESDSVVDAFTDSEFHLGGTNAKGYIFGGGMAIAKDIDLSARWYSAREITGPPYSVDVIQLDLNGRF
jgi:hypothetical protein